MKKNYFKLLLALFILFSNEIVFSQVNNNDLNQTVISSKLQEAPPNSSKEIINIDIENSKNVIENQNTTYRIDNSLAQPNANCSGSYTATSASCQAFLVGNGTPGTIRVCISTNNIGTTNCNPGGACSPPFTGGGYSPRVSLFESNGTTYTGAQIIAFTSTSTVGSCFSMTSTNGYAYVFGVCMGAGTTITWDTEDSCGNNLCNGAIPCTTPPCASCTAACPACGFATTPTVAQVTANCPNYPYTPALAGGQTSTRCHTFVANNTTVSFNVIINSTCTGGNVTNFSWTLQSNSCGAILQSGTLASLQFTGLTIGQSYTFCYTFTVPAGCNQFTHYPYFVGACDTLPPTVTNGSRCGTGTVTLGASGCAGGTLNWYSSSTGGSPIATGTTFTTPSISTTTTYYVSCSIPPCESTRAAVVATVNTAPTVTVNSPSVCQGASTTVTATPGTAGTYNYTWTVPAGATAPGNLASFTTSVAGQYCVVIQNTTTNCSSASVCGTVTVNPLPTVTVNSPSVCQGSSTTVTATPGTAGTYNYTWTVPAGATAPGNVASFSTSVAGQYCVVIQNTTTNCSSASVCGTVTVNPLPTVTVNSPSVCQGSSTTVTATPSTAGTYNYTWTVPAGATAPGNVASFSTSVAGQYCLVIQNTTTNCSSASVCGTVTVNPLPTVTVNSPSVCQGSSTTVTATPGTAGTYNYTWTVPAGATAPGNVASFTTSVAGQYCVVIQNTTTNCSSASVCGTVTVNPLPTVTVNSPSVCEGSSTTVTATPGTAGTYNYTWTVPAGATAPGNVASFSTSVAGQYCVVIQNTTTNCSSASVCGTVTVNPLPTVTVNSPSVCQGSSTTVTATPGTAGTYNYTWTVPAGATAPGNVASFSTSVAGQYCVVIQNTTTNCSSASVCGTVTVNPLPTVTVNSPSVCQGSSTTVTATPGTAGTYNYTWTVPAGATPPGNVASFSTSVAGQYCVVIQNTTTNCSSASVCGTVTVNPLPTVTVNSPSVCEGSSTTVTATPGTAGTYNYTWTVPAGATPPGNVASFSTSVAGQYCVVIQNTTTNCSSASVCGTVTVNPLPTVTVNSPSVCQGSSTTVTATPGTAGTYNYTWTVPAGATPPGNVASFSTSVAGQYCVVIQNTTTNCSSASVCGTVTVNPLPTVTVNSPSVCEGSSTTVTATPGTAGTYNYTWTVPAGATPPGNVASFSTSVAGQYCVVIQNTTTNCSSASVCGTVTVNPLPTATISYNSPFCISNSTAQNVTITGTGAYTDGTYSATPTGLSIDANTGAITPSASTANTYTVTYTIPASGGCAPIPVTTSVVITNAITPVTGFSYTTPICKNGINPTPITTAGFTSGGTYTSTPGLTLNNSTGEITLSSSIAGPYTITYTVTADPANCRLAGFSTFDIVITNVPTANISYSSPFCISDTTSQNVTITGTNAYTGGTYSATPTGLSIDANTGAITPSASTANTYTVTYTIPASGGCAAVPVTTSVTITAVPTASISYASPFCISNSTPQNVTITGTGAYTGGTYSGTPGLSIDSNTGAITPSLSTAGSHTVTYTIPASGGCAAVPVTTSVVITNAITPTTGFAYTTPICKNGVNPTSITVAGFTSGGTYTSTPGLTINNSTGEITLSSSTSGPYTITYTVTADPVNCRLAGSSTFDIVITDVPTASISYSSPFCMSNNTPQNVTITGTNAYTGGTYSATPAGLSIDVNTGIITPSASSAGTYTVTYTIPASGGCAAVPVTTSVTITAVPTASISYTSPLCMSNSTAQNVTITGTGAYTGGTYSATPTGLSIDANTGAITPSASTANTYTVTYTIPASGGCAAVPVTTNVTITAVPTASISYSSPFCMSDTTSQNVTITGTNAYTGGTYSATPTGLSIDVNTGAITPSASSAGTYTVTYTIPASGGCAAVPVTTSVTITAVPTASISYSSPFCSSTSTAQNVTITGTGAYNGGTYSATPTGLLIDANTGAITPSASTSNTYTVTYTIPASGGCAAVPVITSVTITAVPTASISYTSPLCMSNSTAQSVTITGTGSYTGGAYSATPAGLSIDANTGAITPSASTANTYTVTYTIPASGGCAAVPVTTNVTITAVPTASISYSSPLCMSNSTPQNVTITGTGAYTGGMYSATPTGLSIDANSGAITPSASTANTYIVTYTIPASGGCAAVPVTTSVTITAVPTASISYTSPLCMSNSSAQSVSITGTGAYTGGMYSATPTGLSIDPNTGAINPSASSANTYTVTYTIPASGGCAAVPVTTSVTITAVPTASISYSSPFCVTTTTAQNVTITGTGAYTGGTYSATPAGLSIDVNTGAITPNTSTIGNYTVTYTIPASGGCAAVPVTTSVTINTGVTSITGFSYTSPVCINSANLLPVPVSGFTTGGTYTSTTGLSLNSSTGEINIASSAAGVYTITYSVAANPSACQSASSSTATVTINGLTAPSFAVIQPICYGDTNVTVLPTTSTNSTGSITGTWSPATVSNTTSGDYVFTPNPGQCASTATIHITVKNSFDFTIDDGCKDENFILTVVPSNNSFDSNNVLYSWQFGSNTINGQTDASLNVTSYLSSLNPVPTPPYSFSVIVDNQNCTLPHNIVLNRIYCEIQKGISPNGDGLNDFFDLRLLGVNTLEIYNRYGMKVYNKDNYLNEWVGQTNNGVELPDGTYYYVISFKSGSESKTGWIYINREVK
jgi:gliding motility-associated-like protein